jgi:RND family efflux transporter MFP subunit
MKKLILGAGAAVLLLSVGVMPRVMRSAKLEDAVKHLQHDAPTVVVVRPNRAADPGLTLPGSSVAVQEVVLQARGTGYVSKCFVDIGSVVKAGQVLAILKAPDVDAEFHQAQSQTVQGQATVAQSQADAQRLEASVRQSHALYQSSQGALAQARASAASVKAKVSTARRALLQAQANQRYDQAQLTYSEREAARYRTLGSQGYATLDQVEQQIATAKSARAKIDSDQEAVSMARSNITDAQAAYQASLAAVQSAGFNVVSANENINVAEQSLNSGRRLIDVNRAALGAANENTRRYTAVMQNQVITAPFDGVITARNVEIGSLVNASTAPVADTDPNNTAPTSGLFGVARLDPIEVSVQLPQAYIAAMSDNLPVEVYFRELPNEIFHGKIVAVSGALDAMSRTLQVKVRLPNPKRRLRPGMYADVHFRGLKQEEVLRIPSTAFMTDAKGVHVAIVTSDDHIHLQSVVVGRDFGNEAEILTGLKPDEMVVVSPNDSMVEGLAVTPKDSGTVLPK